MSYHLQVGQRYISPDGLTITIIRFKKCWDYELQRFEPVVVFTGAGRYKWEWYVQSLIHFLDGFKLQT